MDMTTWHLLECYKLNYFVLGFAFLCQRFDIQILINRAHFGLAFHLFCQYVLL